MMDSKLPITTVTESSVTTTTVELQQNISGQQNKNDINNKNVGKQKINTINKDNNDDVNNIGLNKNHEIIHNKRRKPKSRSSAQSNHYFQQQQQNQYHHQQKIQDNKNNNNNIYSKNHLDAWLETCVKDSGSIGGPSSSSEFLDYNQSSFIGNHKKKSITQQQQPPLNQQQHMFPKSNNYSTPFFNLGFQKNSSDNLLSNPYYFNSFQRNNATMLNDDFASLPPLVNLAVGNVENTSIENNLNVNDPNRGFRFSDPCLINQSDNESAKVSGQNTPNKTKFTDGNSENNKLFITLMEQINLLHETNSKICRNLHDTRIDIEALKNSPNFGGMRHRRDSISGISTHSQPLGGFAFGTHSPAPTYHSGIYTPGGVTDVVREVKEAARVREEALLSRVKSMVEERSWTLGEGNLRMMRDIEELKSQIQHLRGDRKESNKRLAQLEAENRYLKQLLTALLQSRETQTNELATDFVRSTPIVRNNKIERSKRTSNASFNLHTTSRDEQHNSPKSHYETNVAPNIAQRSSSFNSSASSAIKHNDPSMNGSKLRITENYEAENESSNGSDKQNEQVMQMEKETLELRRELQEALAAKKMAENRVIALESAVKHLNTNEKSNDLIYRGHHQQNSSKAQITASQIQGSSAKKLSLAGPITDL